MDRNSRAVHICFGPGQNQPLSIALPKRPVIIGSRRFRRKFQVPPNLLYYLKTEVVTSTAVTVADITQADQERNHAIAFQARNSNNSKTRSHVKC